MNAGVAQWGRGGERCGDGKVLGIRGGVRERAEESGMTVGSQLEPRQTLGKLGVGSGRWDGL